MEEIIFVVKESEEGGFLASALGHSIFTDGDDMKELRTNVRESVQCHFEDEGRNLITITTKLDHSFAL